MGVAQIIEHPSYESDSFLNDIALLRLSSDLDLSGTNRAAIQLPFSVDAGSWPARDTAVTAMGWGCTDVLGFEDSCSNYPDALRSVGLSVQASPGDWQCAEVIGYWSPLMMCAGTAGGGADTCSGDSGGPLVVGEGSSAVLAGITSWGDGCGLAGYPGVYTRVTAYVDWVSAQTGITATPATPVVETPAVDGFNALGPTRLFDTRSGSLVGNGG
ncbi:MAG: serine protease, partial [Ilumatobacter sp.]